MSRRAGMNVVAATMPMIANTWLHDTAKRYVAPDATCLSIERVR